MKREIRTEVRNAASATLSDLQRAQEREKKKKNDTTKNQQKFKSTPE